MSVEFNPVGCAVDAVHARAERAERGGRADPEEASRPALDLQGRPARPAERAGARREPDLQGRPARTRGRAPARTRPAERAGARAERRLPGADPEPQVAVKSPRCTVPPLLATARFNLIVLC